jgi:outer membrane receptor protein involved in Fe transport
VKTRAWLLLALLPTVALADARLEARRHFQRGMALVAKGEYDDGIAELQQAYAIKPHPNVLFNIARAYSDAGKPADAIKAYEGYLKFEPPDAEQAELAIARLKGQLPAAKPVEPPAPIAAPKVEPASAQIAKLDALTLRLEQALARLDALEQKQAPPAAPAATPATSESPPADEPADAVPYEEQVVTASRFSQSTLLAPNATTVISGEEIRSSGAHDLVELLERVPGAEVMRMGYSSANVSFRGFNQRTANKVLLLIDGRPMYEDFLGVTLWPELPISLDEIDRIEVIRGPGSALYGANAALGVINVITRAPGTGPSAQFAALAGNGNTVGGNFIASGGGDLRFRASVGYEQADKWSRDFEDGRPDYAPQYSNSSLGLQSGRGNLTTVWKASSDVQIGASAGVNRFFTEMYPPGVLRNYGMDGTSGYAKGDVNAGPVHLQLFWNHLDAVAGPQYAPIGEPSLSTRVSSNIFDGQLVWAHDFKLAGTHRLQLGTEERLKRVDWTYAGGLHQEAHFAGFAQDEWAPLDSFRVMASYRVDRHPLLDNGQPGFAQSPRIAALWLPVPGHAFRATFATAFREPTYLESYTDLAFPVPGLNGASAITTGNTALKPERIQAFELGYRGESGALGLEWDASLYSNQAKDLIELSPLTLNGAGGVDPNTGTYVIGHSQFVNDPATYVARGAELGVKLSPIDRLDLRASAAFQKITASGEPAGAQCVPCSAAPTTKLFGALVYRSEARFNFEVEAGYTSSTTWIEREPDPSNPSLIANAANPLDAYLVLNAKVSYHLANDKVAFALSGTDLGAAHREHPFGNLIGRRIFATVTVTP